MSDAVNSRLTKAGMLVHRLTSADARRGFPSPAGVDLIEHLELRSSDLGVDSLSDGSTTAQLITARWSVPIDGVLDLAIELSDQALHLAIRRHLDALPELLARAARAEGELVDIPLLVTFSPRVTDLDDGYPAYVAPGTRFAISDERVRALLTGVNLYGNPNLAFRELYQNAVDAIRRRRTRQALQSRQRGGVSDAQKTDSECSSTNIHVTEFIGEDGARYVDCVDDGIGMSLAELTEAFCTAGVRAGDLAEYTSEAREIAAQAPGLAEWTNSRFGIGALSYFMVAESVELETTHLLPDGTLGRTVRATAPAPGAVLHIRELGEGVRFGTRVRLRLRDDCEASAVATLTELVIVSPFRVVASSEITGLRKEWSPRELNLSSRHIASVGTVVPGDSAELWWTSGYGGMVSDGIWSAREQFGAVINLTGNDAADLTVDRTQLLALNEQRIDALMERHIPALTEARPRFLQDESWLDRMCQGRPRIADAIVGALLGSGAMPINRGDGLEWDLCRAGYLTNDEDIQWSGVGGALEGWRLSAFLQAGWDVHAEFDTDAWPPVLAARPIDGLLLDTGAGVLVNGSHMSLPNLGAPLRIHVAALLTGCSLNDLMTRMIELGVRKPDAAVPAPLPPTVVMALLQASRDDDDGLLDEPGAFELHLAALTESTTLTVVIDELHRQRIGVPPSAHYLAAVPPDAIDRLLASRHLSGQAPWLSTGSTVTIAQLRARAATTGLPLRQLVARFKRMGFAKVGADPTSDVVLTDLDIRLLSSAWISHPHVGKEVNASMIHATAGALEIAPDVVARRLTELGHDVVRPLPTDPRISMSVDVIRKFPQGADDVYPRGRPLPAAQVVAYSRAKGIPVVDLIAATQALGYTVGEFSTPAADVTEAALLFASQHHDTAGPYLPVDRPVTELEVAIKAAISGSTRLTVRTALQGLGYRVIPWPVPDRLTRDHVRLCRAILDYDVCDLDVAIPIEPSRLVLASHDLGWTVAAVIDAYRSMGFVVIDPFRALPVVRPGPYGWVRSPV